MASKIHTESDAVLVAAYEQAEDDMHERDIRNAARAGGWEEGGWHWYLSRTVIWGMLTLEQKAELIRETLGKEGLI